VEQVRIRLEATAKCAQQDISAQVRVVYLFNALVERTVILVQSRARCVLQATSAP